MLSQITPSFFPRSALDMDLLDRPSSMLARPFANSSLLSAADPFRSLSAAADPFRPLLRAADPFFDTTPSALDVFDPFNEMDRLTGQNIRWLTEPAFLPPRLMQPLVPQKYRITLDCSGFSESSIKTTVKGNKLEISAQEGTEEANRDPQNYSIREIKKTYDLPNYVDTDRLVSFMTSDGMLVVEFPWKEDRLAVTNLMPQIDEANKKVSLNVAIPENIDPSKLHVTCRDHDLIIKADYREKNEDGSTRSKVHYLRRTTLPDNTKWETLKCESDAKNLSICAELGPHRRTRRIPIIQSVGQQQQEQSAIKGKQQQQRGEQMQA